MTSVRKTYSSQAATKIPLVAEHFVSRRRARTPNTGNNDAQQMRSEPLHAFAHGLSASGRWNEILSGLRRC